MGNMKNKTNKTDFDGLIEICNGRMRFEAVTTEDKRVYIVPLHSFSMSMRIIDEEQGQYVHYFYDNGKAIEVDGATWMEAQERLFDKYLKGKNLDLNCLTTR